MDSDWILEIKFVEGVVNAFVVMRDQRICQDFLVGKETIERTLSWCSISPRSRPSSPPHNPSSDLMTASPRLQYGGDPQLSVAPLRHPRLWNFAES